MLRNNLLLLSFVCVLISCKKKDDEIKAEVPFYDRPRTILYSNDFEVGIQSFVLDKNDYTVSGIGPAFLQNGVGYLSEKKANGERNYLSFRCDDLDEGYLKIGCPEPLISPASYEKQRTYELTYIDTLFSYSEIIDLNLILGASNTIAVQIDYQISGYVEIHLGNYKLTSLFQEGAFNDKTVNISIDHVKGTYMAFSDGLNINDQFTMIEEREQKSNVKFIAERWVEKINGVPYVNLTGMRIDKLEIYSY